MSKKFYAKTSGGAESLVELLGAGQAKIGATEFKVSVVRPGLYEVVNDSGTYEVVVVKRDPGFTRLLINGQLCDVTVESEGARLIKKLGLDSGRKKRVKDIKAPMPGMVLKVLAEQGQTVGKGDGILVLEAMKMENLIKSPGEAVVGEIGVKEGQAVEKGQLLIKFN